MQGITDEESFLMFCFTWRLSYQLQPQDMVLEVCDANVWTGRILCLAKLVVEDAGSMPMISCDKCIIPCEIL